MPAEGDPEISVPPHRASIKETVVRPIKRGLCRNDDLGGFRADELREKGVKNGVKKGLGEKGSDPVLG
jgi:hypothetical protein